MKEQKLLTVRAKKAGAFEILGPAEWKKPEDVFAAGWTILQMVGIAEEHVLLLLERDTPAPTFAGERPFGG